MGVVTFSGTEATHAWLKYLAERPEVLSVWVEMKNGNLEIKADYGN
jgi:hypothetical protein